MKNLKIWHIVVISIPITVFAIFFWWFNGVWMVFGHWVAPAYLSDDCKQTCIGYVDFGNGVVNKGPYLRREKTDGGLLLIEGAGNNWDMTAEELNKYSSETERHLRPDAKKRYFYQYDSKSNKPVISSENKWNEAQGEIIDCSRQERGYNLATNTLYTSTDKKVSAHGDYLLGSVISPSKEKIAVISVDGPKIQYPGYFFIGGGEGIWGTRYVEIFSLIENKSLGEVKKLGGYYENQTSLLPCWSKDEEFIFVYEPVGTLWVIEATE